MTNLEEHELLDKFLKYESTQKIKYIRRYIYACIDLKYKLTIYRGKDFYAKCYRKYVAQNICFEIKNIIDQTITKIIEILNSKSKNDDK